MSLSQLTSDIEGKTAKDLADMATEQDTVEFLAKCQTGLVPDVAPKKKEREAIQHKEIVVPAGEDRLSVLLASHVSLQAGVLANLHGLTRSRVTEKKSYFPLIISIKMCKANIYISILSKSLYGNKIEVYKCFPFN